MLNQPKLHRHLPSPEGDTSEMMIQASETGKTLRYEGQAPNATPVQRTAVEGTFPLMTEGVVERDACRGIQVAAASPSGGKRKKYFRLSDGRTNRNTLLPPRAGVGPSFARVGSTRGATTTPSDFLKVSLCSCGDGNNGDGEALLGDGTRPKSRRCSRVTEMETGVGAITSLTKEFTILSSDSGS